MKLKLLKEDERPVKSLTNTQIKKLQYLLKAVIGRIEKLKLQHPRTQESIKTLIGLYEAWDKQEKAAEWRAKLSQTEAVEE